MAVYKCAGRKRLINGEPVCLYEDSAPWRGACPSCGRWFDCDGFGFAMPSVYERKKVTAASSVDAAIKYEPTGISFFDPVLGGGLVLGNVVLVGGPSGSGKTSALLLLLDAVAKLTGKPVLYASAEEFSAGVLAICNRLGITNSALEIMGRDEATSVDEILARAMLVKPYIAVFDSLQALSTDQARVERDVKELNTYCKRTKMCAAVVNHMTKDLDFKGNTAIAHELDAMVAIYRFNEESDGSAKELFGKRKLRELGILDAANYDKALDDRIRTVAIHGKSRQGFAGAKAYFHITEDTGKIEPLALKSKVLQFPLRGVDDDED